MCLEHTEYSSNIFEGQLLYKAVKENHRFLPMSKLRAQQDHPKAPLLLPHSHPLPAHL